MLFFNKKVVGRIGLWNEKYFLYLEDMDFCVRIKSAGFRIIFEPSAVIWHKNAGSSGGAGAGTSVYYQSRNRLYFAFKHGSLKIKLTFVTNGHSS